MVRMSCSGLALSALLLASSPASSQPAPAQAGAAREAAGLALGQVRPMTVAFAKRLVAAAIKATCSPPAGSCSGAFAIADDAGVIIYLEALDGVLAGGPELAIKKAKTSALWRRPTQAFLDSVNKGTNTSYADGSFPDMTTSPGGVPLLRDGRIVGGFGQAAVGSNAAVKQVSDAVAAEAARLFGRQ
jgi:glc operon protein GlcG